MHSLLDFYKALADETRLRLLIALLQHPLCVCELSDILEASQPKVSKHLAKLKDLGFVSTHRKEKYIYYHLALPNPLMKNHLQHILTDITEFPLLHHDQKRLALIAGTGCLLTKEG